jgi:restriction system protein
METRKTFYKAKSLPKQWDSNYDPEQSILIIEIELPDVVYSQILKKVELKTKTVDKLLAKKEIKEYVPKIHPTIILRIAYEIFRNDKSKTIELLVINGWIKYYDPATGTKTKTYTASIVCKRKQIIDLNLTKLDPLVAFANLKGKSAGALIDIIPVTPTMVLNKEDNRFIETKKVLENLNNGINLALMDWQNFESLIAELFQKEFAEEGAQVKVTQSSRDRGVDAIIFDPDPIKGGKFVVQAKRYTKTVDVSAVRDLCAVVKKEGASRGILVTTSNYGTDAYTFIQNEPVTLLNGSELLGLLKKHGYKFRINLEEARKLLKETEPKSELP